MFDCLWGLHMLEEAIKQRTADALGPNGHPDPMQINIVFD